MKWQAHEQILAVRTGAELELSTSTMIELIRAVLDRGVPFRFQARGFSMTPFVKDRDVVTILPLSGNQPAQGDIVAFIQPETGKLIVHRIIARSGKCYNIKGDNSLKLDKCITRDAILGKVVKVERGGKDIALGLGQNKRLISILSHYNLLSRVTATMARLLRSIIKGRRST